MPRRMESTKLNVADTLFTNAFHGLLILQQYHSSIFCGKNGSGKQQTLRTNYCPNVNTIRKQLVAQQSQTILAQTEGYM